ncbi:hypothetical protein [Bradyrhizobium sp. CB3481]|uniref:hypothetical protein n=1 Tax=Bradyrhizobium sp. CB3481 TaxID=3039158 RepID=UPI0024B156FF|nr:hypothetical protein [Bradyrhizobium sp. CB3481]WFU19437.1 hypothetical protein QA643_14450 [Bradyrhizobium sp. CB3481]
MNGVVTWGSVADAIGALATSIGLWTRTSDGITSANSKVAAAVDALAEHKRLAAEAVAEAKRQAAEATAKADQLSSKLYQIEIWARDEFVRKRSFETVVARVERGFADLKPEITGRLDRMSDRIEKINNAGEH